MGIQAKVEDQPKPKVIPVRIRTTFRERSDAEKAVLGGIHLRKEVFDNSAYMENLPHQQTP